MKHLINNFNNQDDKLDFDKLYNSLEVEVSNGNINRKDKGDLALYDYSRQCQFEGSWNDATLISRGLVLDVKNKRVVALPYTKFFNYGDENNTHGVSLGSWETAEVSWKEDGSLGVIYFYQNEWHVNTRGSFNSDQAIWAKKWLDENVSVNMLDVNYTYLGEIIYDENQIVARYDFQGIVLHGMYNTLTLGYREPRAELKNTGFIINERSHLNTIEEILVYNKNSTKDVEGVVVYFPDNGTRVKIKGDEYCRIHKILSHHSPLVVWENYRDRGSEFLKEYKLTIPEEFWDETDDWHFQFQEALLDLLLDVRLFHDKTKHLSNKELGLRLGDYKSNVSQFIFTYRKYVNPAMFGYDGSKERKKLFDIFKPSGNVIACQ
jgi:RNA ligase